MKVRNIFCILAILIVGFYFGQKYHNIDDVSVVEATDSSIKKGPGNFAFRTFYFTDKENDKEYIVIYDINAGIAVTPRLK